MKWGRLLLKPVELTWTDISCDGGWHYHDQLGNDNINICVSYGWLLKETPKLVKVAMSYANRTQSVEVPDDRSWGEVLTVPLANVVSIKPIRVGR